MDERYFEGDIKWHLSPNSDSERSMIKRNLKVSVMNQAKKPWPVGEYEDLPHSSNERNLINGNTKVLGLNQEKPPRENKNFLKKEILSYSCGIVKRDGWDLQNKLFLTWQFIKCNSLWPLLKLQLLLTWQPEYLRVKFYRYEKN